MMLDVLGKKEPTKEVNPSPIKLPNIRLLVAAIPTETSPTPRGACLVTEDIRSDLNC